MNVDDQVVQDVMPVKKEEMPIEQQRTDTSDVVWYSPLEEPFMISGFHWFASEGRYRRLPVSTEYSIPEAVDILANHTAGGQIRFVTNSSKLFLRVTLSGTGDMYHMAATGQCGFDCYAEVDGKLHYRSTTGWNPRESEYESVLFFRDAQERRFVVLNFPLYQGVKEIQVGLKEGALVEHPPSYEDARKIIVYGTSITQGACASRPGMCYTNILSRKMNREFINFGFSGSGKGEPELAHIIASISDPACLVLDYEANSVSPELYAKTLPQFIQIYREKHPTVPILILSRLLFSYTSFDPEDVKLHQARKHMQMTFVESLHQAGDCNIHFYDGEKLLPLHAHECYVDGTHPTDLGFIQIANGLEPVLREILAKNS
ncbi:SGNH/GDSL hydrolase family protein [Paenibacillus alvei]|uniref:SGNH/GDSL hydrolase family protein n=1 Tax=Paenibacillus alvei TaxID=44250 RepID=UPI003D27AAED